MSGLPKYLKYKDKYLQLKNQKGGGWICKNCGNNNWYLSRNCEKCGMNYYEDSQKLQAKVAMVPVKEYKEQVDERVQRADALHTRLSTQRTESKRVADERVAQAQLALDQAPIYKVSAAQEVLKEAKKAQAIALEEGSEELARANWKLKVEQNQAETLESSLKKLELQKRLQENRPLQNVNNLDTQNASIMAIRNVPLTKVTLEELIKITLGTTAIDNNVLVEKNGNNITAQQLAECFENIEGQSYGALEIVIKRKFREFKEAVNATRYFESYRTSINYEMLVLKIYGLLSLYNFLIYENKGLQEIIRTTANVLLIKSDLMKILEIRGVAQEEYQRIVPRLKETINNLFVHANLTKQYYYIPSVDKKYLKQ
jgi:hypothetical protein